MGILSDKGGLCGSAHTTVAVLTGSTAQAASETARRAKLSQFIRQPDTGADAKVTTRFVDLNGDGIAEALVIIQEEGACGAHGCSATCSISVARQQRASAISSLWNCTRCPAARADGAPIHYSDPGAHGKRFVRRR